MAMVAVPRQEILELLGLPADADDETLQKALDKTCAEFNAQKAAERTAIAAAQLEEADKRVIEAAVAAGKLAESGRGEWLQAMKSDREGTTQIIQNLAPGLRPDGTVPGYGPDPDAEYAHNQVMQRLGIANPPGPRPVAASGPAPAPRSTPDSLVGYGAPIVDGLGLPIPQVPPPVRIVQGKDPQQWTSQERDDALLWQLGPAFRRGLRPPPGGDAYYQPSPNDHSYFDERTGEWRPKEHRWQGRPYRPI